jgi:hypothetical protein
MKLKDKFLVSLTIFLLLNAVSSFASHPEITDDAGTLGKEQYR